MEDKKAINKGKTKRTPKSKQKPKMVTISQGKESSPVYVYSSERTKLSKVFNYKKNYISESLLPEKTLTDYLLPSEYSCDCLGNCTKEECQCIISHNQKYECNDNCSCSERLCSNRLLQKGIQKKMVIKYINKTKGFGVFVDESITKGDFICEYIGEIIPKEQAEIKIQINQLQRKPNYILQIREHYSNVNINTFIDAERYGNVSRFLNHSCDANLYFDFIRYEHYIPHVAFFAKDDIEEGSELTFSYCDMDDRSISTNNHSDKLCECGTEKCMKYLPN